MEQQPNMTSESDNHTGGTQHLLSIKQEPKDIRYDPMSVKLEPTNQISMKPEHSDQMSVKPEHTDQISVKLERTDQISVKCELHGLKCVGMKPEISVKSEFYEDETDSNNNLILGTIMKTNVPNVSGVGMNRKPSSENAKVLYGLDTKPIIHGNGPEGITDSVPQEDSSSAEDKRITQQSSHSSSEGKYS